MLNKIIIGILILAIIILSLWKRERGTPTVIYKKGLDKVKYIKGKDSTKTVKVTEIKWKTRTKTKYIHDTVDRSLTARDTIRHHGFTIALNDSIKDGEIHREWNVTKIDSMFFITKVDTVDRFRVDTMVIEKAAKKGGFMTGLGVGYVAGFATGVLLAK